MRKVPLLYLVKVYPLLLLLMVGTLPHFMVIIIVVVVEVEVVVLVLFHHPFVIWDVLIIL
jgi:hypothetical protein